MHTRRWRFERRYLLSDVRTAGSCWKTSMSIKRGGVYVCVYFHSENTQTDSSRGHTRGHNAVIKNQCHCFIYWHPVRVLDYFQIETHFAVVGGLLIIKRVSYLMSTLIPSSFCHQTCTITPKHVMSSWLPLEMNGARMQRPKQTPKTASSFFPAPLSFCQPSTAALLN